MRLPTGNTSVKRRIKTVGAKLLHVFGVPTLMRREQSLIILCYHRVLTKTQLQKALSSSFITLHEATFAKQMAILAKDYAVLPLEEALDALAHRRLPRKAVAITFDDGWEDTASTALPILKHFDLPSMVYLATGFIGTKRMFWQERLQHCINEFKSRKLDMLQHPSALHSYLEPDLREAWDRALARGGPHTLIQLLKTSSSDARQRLLGGLERFLDYPVFPAEANRMLNWNEVQQLPTQGMALGSHTVDHIILMHASAEERKAQLEASSASITEIMGRQPRAFAYPNGDHNFASRKAVLEAGYTSAVTLEQGRNEEDADLMRLKRVNMYERKTASVGGFSPDLFHWVLTTGT